MRSIIAIISLFVFTSVATAQVWEPPFRTFPVFPLPDRVAGKVESIENRPFFIDKAGKESMMSPTRIEFDEQVRVAKIWRLEAFNDKKASPTEIKYDDKGRKSEITFTDLTSAPLGKFSYAYSADGKSVDIAQTSNTDKDLPTAKVDLDDKGRTAAIQMNYKNEGDHFFTYTYNDQGHLAEIAVGKLKDGFHSQKIVFTYNEKGDLAKIETFMHQQKFENMMPKHFYEARNFETYEYKYDDQGNWTERERTGTTYFGKQATTVLNERTKRKINYVK